METSCMRSIRVDEPPLFFCAANISFLNESTSERAPSSCSSVVLRELPTTSLFPSGYLIADDDALISVRVAKRFSDWEIHVQISYLPQKIFCCFLALIEEGFQLCLCRWNTHLQRCQSQPGCVGSEGIYKAISLRYGNHENRTWGVAWNSELVRSHMIHHNWKICPQISSYDLKWRYKRIVDMQLTQIDRARSAYFEPDELTILNETVSSWADQNLSSRLVFSKLKTNGLIIKRNPTSNLKVTSFSSFMNFVCTVCTVHTLYGDFTAVHKRL